MSFATRLVVATVLTAALLVVAALLLKRYATKYEFVVPLIISAIALAVSLVSAFKNELFDFALRVVPGELTLAVPTSPSHRSLAIIYAVSFINEGYGHGIVEAVALKIQGADGVRLYTPIAEVDYEKFLQGKRLLHGENIRGPFAPFVLGSREASKHFILLSQEEKNEKYPFKEWTAGRYRFEFWVKTSADSRANPVDTHEWEISQEMIDKYFKGEGAVLTDQKIDVR